MRFLLPVLLLLLAQEPPPRRIDRVVAAFYAARWDAEKGEGMTKAGGGDALQDHPDSFKDFSYRSHWWHRKNLEEMAAAGIDVALCEFAANPAAVDALVQALESAEKDKKKTAKVAPVIDDPTRALALLGRIPNRFLATADGRPMVWFPASKRAAPATLEATRLIVPFFAIAAPAWGKADLLYSPGGDYDGPREMEVITLGPGYRDGTARIRDRADGAWYDRSWYLAMKMKPRIVAIESWNRFDEGSTVCPTDEHKKTYIERTKKYAALFKKGEEMDRPKGRYSSSAGASYHLKFNPPSEGLAPVAAPGAAFETVTLADEKILMSKPVEGVARRVLAFAVDDSYALYERREYEVQVQILDTGPGSLVLEYDAASPGKGGTDRTRRAAEPFYFTNSGGWATATFRLPEAAFANRQEGGSDFRLVREKGGISIRWIQLRAK